MIQKFKFLELSFFTSAATYNQCPKNESREIAFVGASNAGKSSAINALSNNRKLAKISKTPGKTKLFNFFKCGEGYIVDFPGYGFSKVSKNQKKVVSGTCLMGSDSSFSRSLPLSSSSNFKR